MTSLFHLLHPCRDLPESTQPLDIQWSSECPPHVFHDFCEISAPRLKRCSLAAWRHWKKRAALGSFQLLNLVAGMEFPTKLSEPRKKFTTFDGKVLDVRSSPKMAKSTPWNVIPSVPNKSCTLKVPNPKSPYEMNSWDAPSGNKPKIRSFCFATAPQISEFLQLHSTGPKASW